MAKERLPRIVAPLGGGTGITSDNRLVSGVTGRGRALSLSDGMVAMPKGGQPGRTNAGNAAPYTICALPKPQQFASLKPELFERDLAASLRFDGCWVHHYNLNGGGVFTDRYLRSENYTICDFLPEYPWGNEWGYRTQANLSNESTFTTRPSNGFWRNEVFEQSSPTPENPFHYSWVKASGVCTATKEGMQTAGIGEYPLFALVRMWPFYSYSWTVYPYDFPASLWNELLARWSATFTATRTQNAIMLTVSVNNPYLVAGAGTWSVTIDLAALDALQFHPRITAQFSSGIEAAPREPVTLITSWAGTFDAYHASESWSPMMWTFGIWPF